MPPAQKYKRYRILVTTPTGQYIVATSNTVNDLVDLTKSWFLNTSEGIYLPDNTYGLIILQQLDPVTGAYRNSEQIGYEGKDTIINQLRKLGGR